MTEETVLRLYQVIVERVRAREPGPVTVAELHRQIVPYPVVRSAIGVALKADYEHALLRLLAGERGLLRVEPESACRELRDEARSPYPAIDLFHKFYDNQVRITLPELSEKVGVETETVTSPSVEQDRSGGVEPEPAKPESVEPEAAEPEPAKPESVTPEAAEPDADEPESDDPADPGEETIPGVGACPFCGAALPGDRPVVYCPSCGADQALRPCLRCGAALEDEWRFCINCGLEVDA